jgi:hypothetical protein
MFVNAKTGAYFLATSPFMSSAGPPCSGALRLCGYPPRQHQCRLCSARAPVLCLVYGRWAFRESCGQFVPGGRNFASSLPLLFDAATPSVAARILRLSVVAFRFTGFVVSPRAPSVRHNGTLTKDVLGLFAMHPDVAKTLVVVAV